MDKDICKKIFRDHNIRGTRQRQEVYCILAGSSVPLTAKEVFTKCMKKLDNVSFSTVYRILDLFVAEDLVAKNILFEDNPAVYEIRREDHKHHLVCSCCGKIVFLDHCPLENYVDSVGNRTDFEITDHKLELFGICPDCRKNKD